MEILIIHASPRKDSNTDQVIERFMKYTEDHTIHDVYLYDNDIKYCTGCLVCGKKGICIINDDMQKLYDLFEIRNWTIQQVILTFSNVLERLNGSDS